MIPTHKIMESMGTGHMVPNIQDKSITKVSLTPEFCPMAWIE